MTLDEAIVELRALDPYSAYPITDAQEEAALLLIYRIQRVRAELTAQRETRVANDPALAVVDDIARALDGAP